MTLGDNAVLGVAMGSSEAAGYVTPHGALTNWLNELAFVPIDADPHAPEDEWSKDIGCGVQYFSQQAVARLIPVAGLEIDATLQPDVKLKQVQALMDAGDARVRPIYETIGIYLGYALAYYAEFYKVRHAMILGRVTTGPGGEIILDYAQQVLDAEFPELASQMHLFMPTDETERRHGQAIAAASLPSL
jgi:predicted NBD/HSP70 family sugar kinase